MKPRAKTTTVISTKGQVILPKALREERQWGAGTRLSVENTQDGVLLKSEPLFEATTSEEVFGSLRWTGPAKSIEEMNAAIEREAGKRNARDRH